MYINMYIYMYIHVYIYIYLCIEICICVYICIDRYIWRWRPGRAHLRHIIRKGFFFARDGSRVAVQL